VPEDAAEAEDASEVEVISVLAEMDLETNEIHNVLTLPSETTRVESQSFNDYFIYVTVDEDLGETSYWKIDFNEEVSLLSTYQTEDRRRPQFTSHARQPNVYMTYESTSDESWDIIVNRFGSDENFRFTPPSLGGGLSVLWAYENEDGLYARALLYSDDQIWMISTDNTAELLGRWSANYGSPLNDILSPDGRYVLTYYEDEGRSGFGYRLWDLHTMQMIMQSDDIENFGVVFANLRKPELGLIVSERGRTFRFYRDGEVIELPEIEGGWYGDLLPNGEILFSQSQPDSGMNEGVYRYNVETDDFTLLVEGGIALTLREQ
jgi:hypothetical protein